MRMERVCHIGLNAASTAHAYKGWQRTPRDRTQMIDSFALALTHGLMALAAWRLLFRPDLDDEDAPGA
jgi:hypothetical protein